MGIEVKERKVPGKLDSNAAALIAETERAGFSELGWLSVKVFTPTTVAGFVDQTGKYVLAIVGMNTEGAFQAVAVELVTVLASGETITTTSNRTIFSQPDRGIFKYSAPAKAGVRKLVNEHAKNLKKHKSKAVSRAGSIKDLAEFIEQDLKHEMEGLLVRHWLAPKPVAGNARASKASGIEGGYVPTFSNTIRIGLENGKYIWGGWDIHDSGTYKVISQSADACVISLNSSLGGARRIEVTREGKKYLFTPLPERTDPQIFLRLDGAEFLSDSKSRPKIEKPELGEGKASGAFLPVEKTVEEFEKGFLQNVRKEVIRLLIRDGILTGKTVKKKVHVLDDKAFRRAMRFGIESFVLDQQGWSFVAFKAPFDNVAEALRARKDVSSYQENVGASELEKEACAPASEGRRHVFLMRMPPSGWSILIQTIHWVEIADFVLGEELAKDLSKRLKCTAIAAGDTDAGGSGATVYKNGKTAGAFSTEEDWEQFYALFYTEGIFLPESFIAKAKKQPRLMVRDPAAVDRVDYMQIALPETDE
jgi:hypothetical protein